MKNNIIPYESFLERRKYDITSIRKEPTHENIISFENLEQIRKESKRQKIIESILRDAEKTKW
ncbi:MAG: hypothetical protein Q7R52_00875 [archaeon]|nr:hypothetical protein [archaeon]